MSSDLDLPPPSAELPVARPGRSLYAAIRGHAALLGSFVCIMWVLQILSVVPLFALQRYGIRPRTTIGLFGILLAPFLHTGFPHLMANTLPFILLGGVVLLGGSPLFWKVTLFVIIGGGLGVWALAPAHTIHIGASGLIFGYLGFLLARGIVERSVIWILVAVAIFFLYGQLLYGVLPFQPGVSWQSHLFGFFAGIGAAKVWFSGDRHLLKPGRRALPPGI